MKATMISIRPQHTCNILNLIKLWEIRKMFPKDYVGWVYIYCTKDKNYPLVIGSDGFGTKEYCNGKHYPPFIVSDILNGKVVARFWCDKVEEIKVIDDIDEYNSDFDYHYETESLASEGCIDFTKKSLEGLSCLDFEELDNYLQGKNGCAIHITKLEIFDKPKEISEFEKLGSYNNPTIKCKKKEQGRCNYGISPFTNQWCGCERAKLTRAPQSWCYVEVRQ